MANIVIFGAGRVASIAKRYIDLHGPDRVVGFTVDLAFKTSETFEGLPLVAWEHLEERFPPSSVWLLGPLSSRLLNEFRRDRYLEGKRRGYSFTSFVHPEVHNDAESIGDNAFILMPTVIEPFVRIGNSVIVWGGAHIGHHSTIEDYCWISAQVGIGSASTIGERTFFGNEAFVDVNRTLGAACYIGSRAFVKRDLPAQSVVIPEGDPVKPYASARIKRIT
jgi:acetyltransferase-like isoleucine patch superfamily enzyme